MKSIIISRVQSNKSENLVWMVCIQGSEQGKNFCRNAYTAMKVPMPFRNQQDVLAILWILQTWCSISAQTRPDSLRVRTSASMVV